MDELAHPRRRAVLWALVRDYIQTREPVASKALVERHEMNVSSATVRNDMAVLEEAGYIYQPHTSAGRVPTERGYREFVNQIGQLRPLSTAQKKAIQTFLTTPMGVGEVMQKTVRLLAQLTSHAAVAQYPVSSCQTLQHVELVSLSPRRLMVVAITDVGDVEQIVVEMPEDLDSLETEILRTQLNVRLAGLPIDTFEATATEIIPFIPTNLVSAATLIIRQMIAVLQPVCRQKLVVAGISNLARSGQEFTGDIGAIIEALEEHAALLRLFEEYTNLEDVHVSIGSENHDEALSEVSVVAASYGGGDTSSQLGVIGPTRMDYASAMSAVRTVASYLSRTLER
ncbi:heat-inducible transcriptional repressor HrcA [Actinomycetaceae bacterium TAE3-ERU4]|nr:heat-inducible transcriptional repressor HrcA [Actinomycetaceae bacterium TAE3-ERU4]